MKHQFYTCNLCGEKIAKRDEIYSFPYKRNMGGKAEGIRSNDTYMLSPNPDECDRHLCGPCVRDILASAPKS
jgi:hypothetical protein